MTLEEKQHDFLYLFTGLFDWQDKFNYLILLGEELPTIPDELRTPANLITGCQSRTYFHACYLDNRLQVNGWSNAAIPSGLVAVVHHIFQGCSKLELQESVIDFHTGSGLLTHLSPNRADALNQMVQRLLSAV